MESFDNKILRTMTFGFVLLLLVGIVTTFTLREYQNASRIRTRTHQILTLLERLTSTIRDAESGQRGFLLTGKTSYLGYYESALTSIPVTSTELRSLVLDNEVQSMLDELDVLLKSKITEMQESLRAFDSGGKDQALAVVETGRGQATMSEIRETVGRINSREIELLEGREARVRTARALCYVSILTALGLAFILKGFAFYAIRREIAEKTEARKILDVVNQELETQVRALKVRNAEASMLSALTTILHSCQDMTEAYSAVSQYATKLFPATGGALYMYNASGNYVESVSRWGNPLTSHDAFHPDDCWALRTGRLYNIDAQDKGVICRHVSGYDGHYICLPMLAHGDAMGLFYIEFDPALLRNQSREYLSDLASTFAGVVAPALVNLKLREALRQQSIRDPLTGLYNRRFMEESLGREIEAAVRRQSAVSAIMIDLDHFKKLNDTYGHEAGDLVLKSVGRLLLDNSRGEDICCRYGGEELTVILPHTVLQDAITKAEALRLKIEEMELIYRNSVLKVTASMGISEVPAHGTSGIELLRSADSALYNAKKTGRNRAVAFTTDAIPLN